MNWFMNKWTNGLFRQIHADRLILIFDAIQVLVHPASPAMNPITYAKYSFQTRGTYIGAVGRNLQGILPTKCVRIREYGHWHCSWWSNLLSPSWSTGEDRHTSHFPTPWSSAVRQNSFSGEHYVPGAVIREGQALNWFWEVRRNYSGETTGVGIRSKQR